MMIREITGNQMPTVNQAIVTFFKKYGDGRITHKALRWLLSVSEEDFDDGTLIAYTSSQKKITGVIVFSNYGIQEALIAVHPEFRKQGVGEELLHYSISRLSKIYTRVACDNIPSLKLCFACGLRAFQIINGPTGKPTFWLGGGDWVPEDINSLSPDNIENPKKIEKKSVATKSTRKKDC